MLEDFRLRIFLAVAEKGSFTKAANILGVSQPAVSQNIAELEKMTGVKLFERLRAKVEITKEGKVFEKYAKGIISSYAEVSRLFRFITPAQVSLSVSDEIYSYILAPVLEEFTKIHPQIQFMREFPQIPDISIRLQPTDGMPFDLHPDAIARVRLALMPPQKDMGDLRATHESLSYFNLLYIPSEDFARTALSSLLRDYLTESLARG